MAQFSKNSIGQLGTAHPALAILMQEVVKKTDISILKGYRGEKEQNAAFNSGASKLKFPNSKHNSIPSLAVDIAPFPIDWKNTKAFIELAKIIFDTWNDLKIKGEVTKMYQLRWGGNWQSEYNGSWKHTKFTDMPHWELYIK